MLEVAGLNYPAIICRDLDETVTFYRRLGCEPLFVEPNRDDAESVTALLDVGGETFLMLVGPTNREVSIAEASPGVGSMQYLSLRLSAAAMDDIYTQLSAAGVRGSEVIERGFERLVFMEDPNGVLVTLTAWVEDPPPGVSRAQALRRAGELREAAGAPFVEASHLREALAALRATGEASAGGTRPE